MSEPLEIEVLPFGVVMINGVKFSRGFFETLENPDPNKLYSIRKHDDVVLIEQVFP
jgi:hypothetical protein